MTAVEHFADVAERVLGDVVTGQPVQVAAAEIFCMHCDAQRTANAAERCPVCRCPEWGCVEILDTRRDR